MNRALDTAVVLARMIAGTGGPVGVTVTGQATTATTGEFPAFRFGFAPAGLATRRQLSAIGLRPGGAEPVASLEWRGGQRFAYLYDVTTAAAKRPMTAGKWAALGKAMRARRTCPNCLIEADYVIPRSLGECVDCHYGPAEPPTDVPQHTEERWAA